MIFLIWQRLHAGVYAAILGMLKDDVRSLQNLAKYFKIIITTERDIGVGMY